MCKADALGLRGFIFSLVKVPMDVSVIVPVLNNEEGIKLLLECLLAQTLPAERFEIFVVDNGSVDKTIEVVKSYQSRHPSIHLLYEHKKQSSYAARNKAISAVSAEIIAFTDSDCIPRKDWLEKGIAAMKKHSASYGGGDIKFTFLKQRPNLWEKYDSITFLDQKLYIATAGFSATANTFISKELFDRYGLFDETLISGGDAQFGLCLTKKHHVPLFFLEDSIVEHPARSSFVQLYKKYKRIAIGRIQLAQANNKPHGISLLKRMKGCLGYIKKVYLSSRKRKYSFIDAFLLMIIAQFFYIYFLYMNMKAKMFNIASGKP